LLRHCADATWRQADVVGVETGSRANAEQMRVVINSREVIN
jgi:hypothetical protein